MKCYSLSLEFILLHVFTTRYIVEMRIVDDYFFLFFSKMLIKVSVSKDRNIYESII